MSHITQPTKVEGGQKETKTSDDNVQQLLVNILKELRKMNFYLSNMSDFSLENEDVED